MALSKPRYRLPLILHAIPGHRQIPFLGWRPRFVILHMLELVIDIFVSFYTYVLVVAKTRKTAEQRTDTKNNKISSKSSATFRQDGSIYACVSVLVEVLWKNLSRALMTKRPDVAIMVQHSRFTICSSVALMSTHSAIYHV